MNQNKALEIAYKAHIGQLDKGGSPIYCIQSELLYTVKQRMKR